MNGVKYLLDTNFILGMLKTVPEVSLRCEANIYFIVRKKLEVIRHAFE